MRHLLIPVACLLAAAACSSSKDAEPDPTPTPGASPTPRVSASPDATPSDCPAGVPVAGVPDGLRASVWVTGFDAPVSAVAVPGSPGELWVVEQAGTIQRVVDGERQEALVANFRSKVPRLGNFSEQGLLDLVFHPDYPAQSRVFVHYTDRDGDTVIAELQVAAGGQSLDMDSERVLLTQRQPFPNHNGGRIAFGPDGMLYISLGDGGSAGDPQAHGQDLSSLLGTILRIDPDAANADAEYGIPEGNPFVGMADARPEILHYGLRNVWRFDFDAETGDLYMGDVGQDAWEEINVAPAGSAGLNFGWSQTEGPDCFGAADCQRDSLTAPVAFYPNLRQQDCSVTGGTVYRGCRMLGLVGAYFYADWCSGKLRSFRYVDGAASELTEWTDGLYDGIEARPTAIVADHDGELIIVDGSAGRLLRLQPR